VEPKKKKKKKRKDMKVERGLLKNQKGASNGCRERRDN
jgi:hypothetical protein